MSVLPPDLTSIMKRLGLEMILPRLRGAENLNVNLEGDGGVLVSVRTRMLSGFNRLPAQKFQKLLFRPIESQ